MNRRNFAASAIGLLLAPLGWLHRPRGPWLVTGKRDTRTLARPSLPTLPTGCIHPWTGETRPVPDGWALCDGKNDTPDLREWPPHLDAWRAGPSDPWLYIIKQ